MTFLLDTDLYAYLMLLPLPLTILPVNAGMRHIGKMSCDEHFVNIYSDNVKTE